MKKIILKIDGMHCTSCALNIDFDLEDLTGIKSSKTNYAKQISEIEFDELQINLNQIINQIKKTGYSAKL
jgi:Cu+-exporting ATPase